MIHGNSPWMTIHNCSSRVDWNPALYEKVITATNYQEAAQSIARGRLCDRPRLCAKNHPGHRDVPVESV